MSVAGHAGPVIGYPRVRDAPASHLHDLPSEVLDELLDGAVRIKAPAGSIAHRPLAEDLYLELVITGVIRVRDRARRPDDDHPVLPVGRALGAMSLFSDEFAEPATKQALVDTQLLMISPAKARTRAADPALRRALVELSERAPGPSSTRSPGPLSLRCDNGLRANLDLASTCQNDSDPSGELAVRITQQDLAAAVGTVREVVRALRQLRDAGAVRTERDRSSCSMQRT